MGYGGLAGPQGGGLSFPSWWGQRAKNSLVQVGGRHKKNTALGLGQAAELFLA